MVSIRDFILFLKQPGFREQHEILSISSFFKLIWKSFLILFVIDIVAGIISSPFRYFDLFPQQKVFNHSLSNILKISLLMPVIEEFIFRLSLKINKINLSVTLSCVLFLLINRLDIYLAVSLSIILFVFLLVLFNSEPALITKADSYLDRHLNLFFYSQAVIFGLLHLFNYNLDIHLFFLFPFFVVGQILTGCFLGYLRLKYTNGIFLCISTHIFINSIYCLLLYH